jgi:hypothetical protein
VTTKFVSKARARARTPQPHFVVSLHARAHHTSLSLVHHTHFLHLPLSHCVCRCVPTQIMRLVCSICELAHAEPLVTPCGHVFCASCIRIWLVPGWKHAHKACPDCGRLLPPVDDRPDLYSRLKREPRSRSRSRSASPNARRRHSRSRSRSRSLSPSHQALRATVYAAAAAAAASSSSSSSTKRPRTLSTAAIRTAAVVATLQAVSGLSSSNPILVSDTDDDDGDVSAPTSAPVS